MSRPMMSDERDVAEAIAKHLREGDPVDCHEPGDLQLGSTGYSAADARLVLARVGGPDAFETYEVEIVVRRRPF